MCVKGQHNFHMKFDPPKHPERCDMDGSRLVQRDDDKPEVIQHRLQQYHEKTEPLIEYYDRKGMLRRIDASRDPDEGQRPDPRDARGLKFEESGVAMIVLARHQRRSR